MSLNTSLGPTKARVNQEELDATKTVFGRFLLALRSYTTSELPIMGDTFVWCDEPTELAILSGLQVIILKLAQTQRKELTTTTETLAIAERVNRLVSAGMLLEYKTPEVAARAFHEQVILLTRRAHELGYRPGMQIKLKDWNLLVYGNESDFVQRLPRQYQPDETVSVLMYFQMASVAFFAPLVKSARDLRFALLEAVDRLRDHNILTQDDNGMVSRSKFAEETIFWALEVIHYLNETDACAAVMPPKHLVFIMDQLEEAESQCKAFDAFGVVVRQWPINTVYLDKEWLATQILLSHTDEPAQTDVIGSVEVFQRCVAAVKSSRMAHVRSRTRVRLEERLGSVGLSRRMWAQIDQAIRASIRAIKKWDPKTIDGQTLDAVLIRISDREFLLDPRTALAVATGTDAGLLEQIERAGINVNAWLANVGLAIVWAQLEEEDILVILTEEVLPMDVIIQGLVMCEPSVQQFAVRMIIQGAWGASVINTLIEKGLLEPSDELIRENSNELAPEVYGSQLAGILERAFLPDGERIYPTLWKVLGRASEVDVRAFLNDSAHRKDLCSIGLDLLRDPEIPWSQTDLVRRNLGNDLFQMFVLGSIAYDRDTVRGDVEEGGDPGAWEDVFTQASLTYVPIRILGEGATMETVQALLRSVSEAEAFFWACGKTS